MNYIERFLKISTFLLCQRRLTCPLCSHVLHIKLQSQGLRELVCKVLNWMFILRSKN